MAFVQIGPSVYDGTMQYMEEFDACQLLQMAADYKRDTGETLRWGDALRDDAEQRVIFLQRYHVVAKSGLFYDGKYWAKNAGASTAAIPGRSNHRLGIAIDFYMTPKLRVWLKVNAWKYGFTNTQGIASGEEWHWVRDRVPTILAAIRITPTTAEMQEEEIMSVRNIIRIPGGAISSVPKTSDVIENGNGEWAFFHDTTVGNRVSIQAGYSNPNAIQANTVPNEPNRINDVLNGQGVPELGILIANPGKWFRKAVTAI